MNTSNARKESVKVSNWHKCYGDSWGKKLRPASYQHPAKASYALTVRIYEHALKQGWIEPGQIVLDPFAGIGGFALEALRHGLHFRGVELEQRFVDMGQGCDCTGISKADWVHYQGRWDRMRYKDGRHWCPECLMKAGAVKGEWKSAVADKRKIKPLPLPGTKWAVLGETRQATIFDTASTASYVRNSGMIPCTGAHRYHGNIETWEQDGMPGTAVIVQGDSRRLGEVLARASLCLSSPPYANSIQPGGDGIDWGKIKGEEGKPNRSLGRGAIADGYGQVKGNLGNETGSTFWAASRQILEEVYQVLAPGGHAIWVLKMFIRSGRLVDFPKQWEQLCQSVGFRTVCKHRAWMNKNAGIVQTTLDGEEMSMEKWYKSFFRILCEKKGAPRIDWELILCMEKPQ